MANKAPVINGVKDHVIKVGDDFDPNAGVSVDDDSELKVNSNVKTTVPGTYRVLYTATNSKGKTTRAQSTVTVNPKSSTINSIPVITASDKTIKVGDRFTDEDALVGVSAYDKEDKDLTSSIKVVQNNVNTAKAGEYTVIYSVEDSQGAKSIKTIIVTVNPKLSQVNSIPEIIASDKTIKVGDRFTDKDALVGVSAYDKEDKDLTSSIKVVENNVDTTKEGEYTVIYSVEDSQGAKVTKTITVTVKKKVILVDKVTINNKVDKLFMGGYKVLTASISDNADIKDVKWSASNDIVSIESNGDSAKIIAKSAGYVTITVKAVDGSDKSDSVTIEIIDFENDNAIPDNIKDIIDTKIVLPISGTGKIDNPIEFNVKPVKTDNFNEFINNLKELQPVIDSKYVEDDCTVYKIKLQQKKRLFSFKSSNDLYITIKIDNNLENAQELKNILNNISNQAPEIFIDGFKTTIFVGEQFNKLDGVSAIDFEDGNITDKIVVSGDVDTSKAGEYELTYEVTDKNGNKSSITIIITVIEKQSEQPESPEKPGQPEQSEQPESPEETIKPGTTNSLPVINLTSNINKLYVGDTFNALDGVKATDKEDGDLTKYITVSGEVDTSKPGKYTIIYSVKDSDLNEVSLKRVIEVVKRSDTNTTSPKTGDTGILGLVGISGVAFGGLLLSRRKKNK